MAKPLNRRTPRILAGLALLLLAGWLAEGVLLLRAAQFNAQLADPAGIEVGAATPPELLFAKALAAAREGNREEAFRLYGMLLNVGDAPFRARVRYNLGTLYLRDAARLWNARGVLEYLRVNTLVASAKEHLREAVRLQPAWEDARANLDYAYRITPPPKERGKENFQGSKGSVFATLPSIPGGGP